MTSRRDGLAIAVLAALPACSSFPALANKAPPATADVSTGYLAIQLVGLIAWPLAALIIVAFLRRPISALVTALGGRITKLSLFKVELELVPVEAATTPLLDELRSPALGTPVNASTGAVLQQVVSGPPAQFAVIDLGRGESWLTSRIYIAAVMLTRMRGVRAFVFVESDGPIDRRFVATVPTERLRWILALKYPWLEGAWLNSIGAIAPHLLSQTYATAPSPIVSETGALRESEAKSMVLSFIQNVQRRTGAMPGGPMPGGVMPGAPMAGGAMPGGPMAGAPPAAGPPMGGPAPGPDWVLLGGGSWERAEWVDGGKLRAMLPDECREAWVPAMADEPRGRRTRAVLRRTGEFIALLDGDRRFLRLVDREALLEQMAATMAEEPELR